MPHHTHNHPVHRHAHERLTMYVPEHFVPDEAAVRDLLTNHGASDLITLTPQGLMATLLPFEYDPDAGENGALIGHMARGNDQWREPAQGEAMVIVRGPEAYVTPSWYPAKAEHHRVVPTWNYMIAHVYGQFVVHDDPVWIEAQIRRLTDRHEADFAEPWSVDQAPAKFIERQLRAVVGVEVVISRIEAKFKLSQNQPRENVEGVISGLEARGRADDGAVAAAVRAHNPHSTTS
ncbi:FMN-binding negative transcriptional regulator [Streptomyces sp. NPDC056669]|uniref:FMN-binding negative transcriptional regulator n=1 Tax=unclassified Streptomyces TaxID=2593676 RepID=UPI0036A809CD